MASDHPKKEKRRREKMGKTINRDEVSLGNDVDLLEGGMMSTPLCGSTNSHWVVLSWDGNISKILL